MLLKAAYMSAADSSDGRSAFVVNLFLVYPLTPTGLSR